ncbi:MAG: hypothetical protein SGJ09_05910 [Phycisphaerae bacterium]|nr:hypothetical protein [Phycisphaerae bacterium]
MLNSAVVSAWLWIHVGVLLVVVAYAACGSAFLPTASERGREILARSPIRTLLIGLAMTVPIMLVAIVLMNLPNGAVKLVGTVMAVSWLMIGLVGLAPLALHVGARGDAGPIRSTTVMRGGALIALTWMLPVVGWFVALPLTLACGAGCLLLSLRDGQRGTPAAILTSGAPIG